MVYLSSQQKLFDCCGYSNLFFSTPLSLCFFFHLETRIGGAGEGGGGRVRGVKGAMAE